MTQEKKKPSTELTTYRPKPLALPNAHLGSLDDYIRFANSVPMLSEEKEHELAVRLRDTGDPEAAGELIMSHLRLVIAIARQYMGYGLPMPDLVQEGNIGLMKAVKRFDPDNSARLVTFARPWIKAEIQEFVIRNWRLVKIATTKSQRKLFFNLRHLKEDTKLLRLEEANKIADELEVKPSEVIEMEQRLLGNDVVIDEPMDEEHGAPEDWLSTEEDQPENKIALLSYEKILKDKLPEAVKALDPRSRRIIEARYLFDEASGKKAATLADLSKEFGVSLERIRQLEKKAIEQLKAQLSEDNTIDV